MVFTTFVNGDLADADEVNDNFTYITDNYILSGTPFIYPAIESGIGTGTFIFSSNYVTLNSADGFNSLIRTNPMPQEIQNKTISFNSQITGTLAVAGPQSSVTIGFLKAYLLLTISSGYNYVYKFITNNGSDETTTLSDVDLTTEATLKIVFTDSDIKLYVNDVLKATHTTQIPIADDYFVMSSFQGGGTNVAVKYKLNSYTLSDS